MGAPASPVQTIDLGNMIATVRQVETMKWTPMICLKGFLSTVTPIVAVLVAQTGPITQQTALLALAAGLAGFRSFIDTSVTK